MKGRKGGGREEERERGKDAGRKEESDGTEGYGKGWKAGKGRERISFGV